MTSEPSAFDKQLMEIAYMGAFYGLAPQAQAIFDYYADAPHGNAAAALGQAFAQLRAGAPEAAVRLLEVMVDDPARVSPEAKILLAMSYRQMQTRSQRAADLIEQVAAHPDAGAAGEVAQRMAAS